MAASIALTQPRTLSLPRRILELVPGLLLLFAIGYAGKFLEQYIARTAKAHHWVIPNIEYVLWAIVIGLRHLQHHRSTRDLPRRCCDL